MSETVFVKTEEMLKLLGIKRTTLWQMVKDGKLPKPMRFGTGNVWFRESIDRFLGRMLDESEANCAERGNPHRRKFKTKPSTI